MHHEVEYNVHMSHCNIGEYEGNCKYCDHERCPALSPSPELWLFIRKGQAFEKARELYLKGYICISNSYCTVARPDCDDWFDALNKMMYNRLNPDTEKEKWLEHYCRVYTTDKLDLPSLEYFALKRIHRNPNDYLMTPLYT